MVGCLPSNVCTESTSVMQPAAPAPSPLPPAVAFWVRTPCGRAKYMRLAARPGLPARLRLAWFVLIAALRDLGQPLPEADDTQG